MKNINFKKILAENVNENADDFDYTILGRMAIVQRAFDTKYKWVMEGSRDYVKLPNRSTFDTFDTVEDFKDHNAAIIEYFNTMIRQLNSINSKLK